MKNKNLTLVITDNRLMADTIAKAIGANTQQDGYYAGNGYAVTWTNGNIIEETYKPNEAFVMSTNMDCRLFYAHNFSFAMRNIDHLVGYEKSKADAKQLDTIRQLWKMSHTVVNAMLPSFEGELQFLNLYYWLKMPVPVRRAWLPILTKLAIVNAVEKGRKDTEEYEEWLSQSLYNYFLLAEEMRKADDQEVANDLQEMVECEVSLDDVEFDDDIHLEVIPAGETPLFNGLSLILDAEKSLGWADAKTVKLAMRLYTKKLISYPMVLQNTVPNSVCQRMKRNIRILRYNPKWGKLIPEKFKPSKSHNFTGYESVFNGYGIVTTGIHPIGLSKDEWKLYNLIVKRVIDAFIPVKSEKSEEKS